MDHLQDQNIQKILIPQSFNNKVKSKNRIIIIGLSASISAIMLGYSIKQISCIPVQIIVNNYDFTMDQNLLQGILIAILPFGGLFGSLIAKLLFRKVSRIQGMHCSLLLLILSLIIVQITTPISLLIGRFMEGISIGYYASIAPIYLKEISPKQMRSLTGTFFSLGKNIGIILVIGLQIWIGDEGWRILLGMTGVLALIQSIALTFIGIDTPYQWLLRQDQGKALDSLNQLYKSQFVYEALDQIKQEIVAELQKNSTMSKSANQRFQRKKKNAFIVASNVCIIRHFSGGNSLVTSSGIIMSIYSVQLSKQTPLTANFIMLMALIFYICFFSKTIGKRKLLVSSTYMLAFINLLLVFSLILKQPQLILGSIILFMIVYGGILLSAVWSYPSEILAPDQSLIPNMLHWITLSISTLAPQLVLSIMPNNEVYPCFIFFFVYTLLTAVHFHRNIVESNDRTYKQIINEFKEW